MKRFLSVLLSFVIVCSCFSCLAVTNVSATSFTPRTTAPSTSNKYYLHTSAGGVNECIIRSGGSVLPNCVGYAWGRAYEILGTRPNLAKTDAKTWYGYNKNNGYYSYGNTPKLGAIMCWAHGSAGHVAVVEKVEGNTITISESHYSGTRFNTKTGTQSQIEGYLNSFQGYIYIGDFNPTPQEPPTTSNMQVSKSVYGLNDTIEFSFSSDAKIDYYKLQIWSGSILIYNKEINNNKLTINASDFGAGTYAAYVSAVNSYGSCTSSIINFRIAQKLSNPLISINDTQFSYDDTVEFNVEVEGGVDYYGLQIWKGASIVYEKQFIGHTISVPCSKLGTGDYGAFISCINPSSNITTEVVNFRIGYELSNPQISINKLKFDLDDEIIISASADGGVDFFGVQIWRDTELVFSQEFTGHRISLSADTLGFGSYGCFVSCVNEFGNIVTDTKSFSVSKCLSTEHSYTSKINKSATCTESGTKTYTCSTCGDTYTETIPATGHSWKSATCTSKKTCTDCGVTEGSALGHSYTSKVTKQATCTASGTKTFTCSRCNHSYTETIPATGHSWKSATCTSKKTCSTCGVTEGSALGHSYTSKVTKQATCTASGTKTFSCSRCNHSYTETIPATGHSWKSATCTAKKTCTTCGVTEGSALGHSYTSKVTKQPTCTTSGTKTFSCSRCAHSYTETIQATGHSWKSATCTSKKTCSTCGVTEGSALGHNYTSKVTKQPTCTASGTKTFSCSRCTHSYTETIPAKGHTIVIDKPVPPTATESGLTQGEHCGVCGKVLIPQEVIKPLGITGDVDGDGKVTIKDSTTIQKHIADLILLDNEHLALSDANGDGVINISDSTQIQKYLADLIDKLG